MIKTDKYAQLIEQLERASALLADAQRQLYDYNEVIKEYINQKSYSWKDQILFEYVATTMQGKKPVWVELTEKVKTPINLFLELYEIIMRHYYYNELLQFSEKKSKLLMLFQNLSKAYTELNLDHIKVLNDQLGLFGGEIKTRLDWLEANNRTDPSNILPTVFISKGFSEEENKLNEFFEGYIEALKIVCISGEPYDSSSIPEKIRKRIDSSDALIAIIQKRYSSQSGTSGAGSAWVIREIEYSLGKIKPVIILAEKGVETAGFEFEKEIIYFDLKDQPLTTSSIKKLLQALTKYGLTGKTTE